MSTLGKAVIEFSADTAKFTGDVGRAAAVFDKSMGQMERGINNMRGAIATLVGFGGIGILTQSVINAGEELNKLSQKSGLSVEALSELKHGARLADVDVSSLAIGLKGFNKSIVEAGDSSSKSAQIFRALGLDITRGPEVALKQLATRFAEMEDGSVKSTLAVELFGKAGADMIPWLNSGADGMQKAAEQAKALGLTMSAEQAQRFEQFNDNMKTLGFLSEVVGKNIANTLVPGVNSLTQNLIQAAEKGNLLFQTFVEGAKVLLALNSALTPDWLPQGKASNAATEALFNWDERQRSLRMGANVWPGASPAAGPSGTTNRAALASALAGGQPKGGGGAAAKDPRLSPDQISVMQLTAQLAYNESINKEQSEVLKQSQDIAVARTTAAELLRDELDTTRVLVREQEAAQLLADQGVLTQEEANRIFDERQLKIFQATRDQMGLNSEIKKGKDVAADLGFTFSSAFEDWIVKGGEFRDLLKGIEQDIARIIIRKSITQPAGDAISNAITNSGAGSAVRDFFKNLLPSFAVGTSYVPHDMIAQVHAGERIIPASENVGGGMGALVVNNYIDSRADAATVAANARAGVQQAYAQVFNDVRNRGAISRAIR